MEISIVCAHITQATIAEVHRSLKHTQDFSQVLYKFQTIK